MNKTDLVLEVSSRTGLEKRDVGRVVNAVLDAVRDEVAGGGRVTLADFGTFEARQRAPRTGRNPHTGEAVRIRATVRPSFRPGTAFRRAVGSRRRSRRAAAGR